MDEGGLGYLSSDLKFLFKVSVLLVVGTAALKKVKVLQKNASGKINLIKKLYYLFSSCSSKALFASIRRLNAVILVNTARAAIGMVKIDIGSKIWNFIPGTYNL